MVVPGKETLRDYLHALSSSSALSPPRKKSQSVAVSGSGTLVGQNKKPRAQGYQGDDEGGEARVLIGLLEQLVQGVSEVLQDVKGEAVGQSSENLEVSQWGRFWQRWMLVTHRPFQPRAPPRMHA
jgi:hypothetical protein